MTIIDPNLQQQALALADGACRADIEILAMDRGKGVYALTDEEGRPVSGMAQAQWRLRQAVSYLAARHLATLSLEGGGIAVRVHVDRFSEASNGNPA